MPDDFPEVRKLLDTVPVPEPRPVDLAAIYRAVADRQAVAIRRWRRAAVATAVLAASVLAFALLPRLEFHVSDHEFAVRWGTTPEPVPQPLPSASHETQIEELLDQQSRQLAAIRAANAKHAELQDLLLTLAADVSDRDRLQRVKVDELTKQLASFEADTARQFADTEKTNTALYDAVFSSRKAKANP